MVWRMLRVLTLHFNRQHQLSAMSLSSQAQNLVVTETQGPVRLIGINRAKKRNCVNHATALQLIDAFDQFESDDSVKVGILHGKGGTFCAGYDLSEVAGGEIVDAETAVSFLQQYRFMGPSMMRFSKPVIAAIDGFAVAGGLELALMCDMRVADESAKFGVFCRRFGVPLIDGGTVRLPKLIGLSRAMDMILTGREVDAKTAFDWGLVNRLTPDGTSLKVAIELANTLAAFPQACMNADKRSSYYAAYDASSHQDAFDYELRQGRDVLLEAQKGAKKFTDGKGKHGSFDSWTKPSKL